MNTSSTPSAEQLLGLPGPFGRVLGLAGRRVVTRGRALALAGATLVLSETERTGGSTCAPRPTTTTWRKPDEQKADELSATS